MLYARKVFGKRKSFALWGYAADRLVRLVRLVRLRALVPELRRRDAMIARHRAAPGVGGAR